MRDGELLLEFASCNRQNLPQEFWHRLKSLQPAAFMWMGDAVYAKDNSVASQREALREAKESLEYAAFAASTPVCGTWDDHGELEYP